MAGVTMEAQKKSAKGDRIELSRALSLTGLAVPPFTDFPPLFQVEDCGGFAFLQLGRRAPTPWAQCLHPSYQHCTNPARQSSRR